MALRLMSHLGRAKGHLQVVYDNEDFFVKHTIKMIDERVNGLTRYTYGAVYVLSSISFAYAFKICSSSNNVVVISTTFCSLLSRYSISILLSCHISIIQKNTSVYNKIPIKFILYTYKIEGCPKITAPIYF